MHFPAAKLLPVLLLFIFVEGDTNTKKQMVISPCSLILLRTAGAVSAAVDKAEDIIFGLWPQIALFISAGDRLALQHIHRSPASLSAFVLVSALKRDFKLKITLSFVALCFGGAEVPQVILKVHQQVQDAAASVQHPPLIIPAVSWSELSMTFIKSFS